MRPWERLLTVFVFLQLQWVFAVLPSVAADKPSSEPDAPALSLKQLKPGTQPSKKRIHPPIRLLDPNGKAVLGSKGPLSLMKTCGDCHDTTYIARYNYHAQVGLDEMYPPGQSDSGRAWDTGPGMFGRWNPLTYRVLSAQGSGRLDMGTADWIMSMGPRHVGGGPAEFSRFSGMRLSEIAPSETISPETHIIDQTSGKPRVWDWKASGILELNCLVCHMENPNNAARIAAIKRGRFRWASTATLVGSGLVKSSERGYDWVVGAFQSNGTVPATALMISDPRSANCRLCHAKSCRCTDPVVFENSLENWAAETTGEIFSPAKMFDSGMNLEDKVSLSRPWDVHAQRLLACVNCHYSMNNPTYSEKEPAAAKPRHLRFDARRLSENDYLLTPDHNLAKGHSAQGTVARKLDGSMRNCRDCHNAMVTHDFLPYKPVHFEKLACQTCHISRVLAPARRVTDWTIITQGGQPRVEHRGVVGTINEPASLIEGYKPVLLLHEEADGRYRLGPNNLMVSWFWEEGNPERPVRLVDLKAAITTADGSYHSDILAALDADGSGDLSTSELTLDTKKKVAAVAARLEQVGVVDPRIRGEIQPYTHSHGVAGRGFVMADCRSCHSRVSIINREIELAAFVPGGVLPESVKDSRTKLVGAFHLNETGNLMFRPALDPNELYIHGSLRPEWLDIIGIIIVLTSLAGVALHGGLRIVAARQRKRRAAS